MRLSSLAFSTISVLISSSYFFSFLFLADVGSDEARQKLRLASAIGIYTRWPVTKFSNTKNNIGLEQTNIQETQ